MDNKKINITTYNCKHFITDGDKFEFVKTLFQSSHFLLLQELWLYESEFDKLLTLGKHCDFTATTAMDESSHRLGRKYGGTAIVWDSTIKGSITRINFENNRLCGVLFTKENLCMLIINVYMPYDRSINDDEYIDVLNVISQP